MPAAHMPWKTAIHRTKPSAPVQWLYRNDRLTVNVPMVKDPKILDFGGGHGADTDWLRSKPELLDYRIDSWDLYHRQDDIVPPYDIVLCTYVANVMPPDHREGLLWDLLAYMRGLHGRAYVTVRRDGVGAQFTSAGTYQEFDVNLAAEWNGQGDFLPYTHLIYEKANAFAIYEVGFYHD